MKKSRVFERAVGPRDKRVERLPAGERATAVRLDPFLIFGQTAKLLIRLSFELAEVDFLELGRRFKRRVRKEHARRLDAPPRRTDQQRAGLGGEPVGRAQPFELRGALRAKGRVRTLSGVAARQIIRRGAVADEETLRCQKAARHRSAHTVAAATTASRTVSHFTTKQPIRSPVAPPNSRRHLRR